MEDKRITRAEYDEAVKKVMDDEMKDPKLKGEGKILIPMLGLIFAHKIGSRLFDETEDKNDG